MIMCKFPDCQVEVTSPNLLCPAHQHVLILRVKMLERQTEILTKQIMADIPESPTNPIAVKKWQEAQRYK
jgi:hypothetical protein